MKRFPFILAVLIILAGCAPEDRNHLIPGDFSEQPSEPSEPQDPQDPQDPPEPDDPPSDNPWQDGIDYIFDQNALAEFHLQFPLDEWNTLLGYYDADPNTEEYVSCDIIYKKGTETTVIPNSGVRLKGNTSRRRPEDGSGTHVTPGTSWNHCHFGLNFSKFVKDDAHALRSTKKLYLKWFKDDPAYAREVFCFDFMRRVGIWTAVNSWYVRLYIRVEGDASETYYGVYQVQESIDKPYLAGRADKGFLSDEGNLWKCRYGAGLNNADESLFGIDDSSTDMPPYELKTNTKKGKDAAYAQLKDFIAKVSGKTGDSFYQWIQQVTDVDFLLKTYAANVVLGMWDDYWCNNNNYYLYFTTTDTYDYKFFFIPYDYDNTLGTSLMMDSGRQDPLHWGNDSYPLIAKILSYPDFKAKYVAFLKEIAVSDGSPFLYGAAAARIRSWHNMINPYVSNDTGEDMSITDLPASWGNHSEYRLLIDGSNNYFRVKTATIAAIQ
ncbi:MAG: CotH kinase family protein [Bacteroidales bacterium]|nr:CotH kinase family protein [Bacteroidales bacterium]